MVHLMHGGSFGEGCKEVEGGGRRWGQWWLHLGMCSGHSLIASYASYFSPNFFFVSMVFEIYYIIGYGEPNYGV